MKPPRIKLEPVAPTPDPWKDKDKREYAQIAAVTALLALLIGIVLVLMSCAALRGQATLATSGYFEGAVRYVRRDYVGAGPKWQTTRMAAVDNPSADTFTVFLECTVSGFPGLVLPPHTTQYVLLGDDDRACRVTRWLRK